MNIHAVICLAYVINGILAVSPSEEDELAKLSTHLPELLEECYKEQMLFLGQEPRLPISMATLVELLRKVEDYDQRNLDISTFTTMILQRFRFDGIRKDPNIVPSEGTLPYLPSGEQYAKYSVIADMLLPEEPIPFPEDSLTLQERCTMHFMLSSSIYEASLHDVEIICNANNSTGESKSDGCLVETGVVSSSWGPIAAGTLLAGILAGSQSDRVPLDEASPLFGYVSNSSQQEIINLWVATIAGDLAEVVLKQAPIKPPPLQVGTRGHWNGGHVPRVYVINETRRTEMTEGELLGGLDGLFIGSNIVLWTSQYPNLRLSQLLDMYYSQKGVASHMNFRACERSGKIPWIAPFNRTLQQVEVFAHILYDSIMSPVMNSSAFASYAERAVEAMDMYIAYNLNRYECIYVARRYPPKVELFVVVDGSWSPTEAINLVTDLSTEVDISQFGSSFAVINGDDGSWVVEETSSWAESVQNLTFGRFINWPTKLNLPAVLDTLKALFDERQYKERVDSTAGGSGIVVLLLVADVNIVGETLLKAEQQTDILRKENPDVKFVYLVEGVAFDFKNLVENPNRDLIIYSIEENRIQTAVVDVTKRLLDIPGRIINPNCGNVTKRTPLQSRFEGFTNIGQPSYYRIHPFYFFLSKRVRIKFAGMGYGDFVVCFSRVIEQPFNSTWAPTSCQLIRGVDEVVFEEYRPCQDKSTPSDCNPFYFSVAASENRRSCTEEQCRYPDQVKFFVSQEGTTCYSDAKVNRGTPNAQDLFSTIVSTSILIITRLII